MKKRRVIATLKSGKADKQNENNNADNSNAKENKPRVIFNAAQRKGKKDWLSSEVN